MANSYDSLIPDTHIAHKIPLYWSRDTHFVSYQVFTRGEKILSRIRSIAEKPILKQIVVCGKKIPFHRSVVRLLASSVSFVLTPLDWGYFRLHRKKMMQGLASEFSNSIHRGHEYFIDGVKIENPVASTEEAEGQLSPEQKAEKLLLEHFTPLSKEMGSRRAYDMLNPLFMVGERPYWSWFSSQYSSINTTHSEKGSLGIVLIGAAAASHKTEIYSKLQMRVDDRATFPVRSFEKGALRSETPVRSIIESYFSLGIGKCYLPKELPQMVAST